MDPQRKAVGRAAVALVTIIVIALAVIGLAVARSQSSGSTTTSTKASGLPTSSTSNSASETSTSGVHSSYGEGIQVSAPSVARLNPATDLSLHLNLTANANRSVTVRAYDVNNLDRANNVTTEDAWPVFPDSPPVCITSLVGYVVYQGDYGVGNYTQGTPLDLGGNVPTCPATYYTIFSPMSTAVAIYPSPNEPSDSVKTNASISGNVSAILVPGPLPGGAGATLVPLPPGTYTVAAVDQWGNIVISVFTVQGE
jgi:hypothetical protein